MNRAFQFAAAVLLPMSAVCNVALAGDDQAAKKAATPKPEAIVPKGGGTAGSVPKNSNPNRVVNPANPVVMLFKATPEERERALERATPEQQKNARQLLNWFDHLSPADQAIQIQIADRYAALSAADKVIVRNSVAELNHLPKEEQARVKQALTVLKRLPEEQRHRRMENENFSGRFTSEQWEIIKTLADVWFQ